MIKLSVVTPVYKEPFIDQTIKSLLDNSALGNELEVIRVLDGYWPDKPMIEDDRVITVHLGKNRGMRGAINAGVSVARGEFIMRTDCHCMFGNGYDAILTSQCQPDWIVTARRYFLDPIKWEVMDIPYVDYEKLVIQKTEGGEKFSGQSWRSRDEQRKDIPIDETMAMQGSMWVMPHKWWDDVIGELQTDGYGPAYQDSHEMIFKTWKAGGKMMLNKNTWFAHKHRDFPRSHQEGTKENPWIREDSWAYAIKIWKDYYTKEIKPKWGI
jgi:glycosyltransferase involved in cell wall biosynthesis